MVRMRAIYILDSVHQASMRAWAEEKAGELGTPSSWWLRKPTAVWGNEWMSYEFIQPLKHLVIFR
jgi:hypothetical protein